MTKSRFTAEMLYRRRVDLIRDLDILAGTAAFRDDFSNPCLGDAYFAMSIQRKWGDPSIRDLQEWVNWNKGDRNKDWERNMREFNKALLLATRSQPKDLFQMTHRQLLSEMNRAVDVTVDGVVFGYLSRRAAVAVRKRGRLPPVGG